MNSWQVATAAEAFAAGQFARCGWDVSVQYGANQPEYDLVAVSGDRLLKVSVKGSQDGGWGLTQSFLNKANGPGGKANYQGATDLWLAKHSGKTVFCLVQFERVGLTDLPRMYLAKPQEIAQWLKTSAGGRGGTILYEHHRWTVRAQAAGAVDAIPESWVFTDFRLEEIARQIASA